MSGLMQRCLQKASTSAASTRSYHSRHVWQPAHINTSRARRVYSNKDDAPPSQKPSSDKPSVPGVSGSEAEQSVDDMLRPAFEQSKRELIATLGLKDKEAEMVQRMKYEDLDDIDGFLRQSAQETIGPMLEALNMSDEPLTFMKDLFLMGTVLQLSTCLMAYYGTHLGLHYETGEALRITSGLFLGYLTRPFLQVEQFLWPLYNGVVQLLSEGATYEVPRATAPQMQRAVNVIAFVVAGTFLLPQAILLWTPDESLRLALPMAAGWVAFDLCYSVAILAKCRLL